MVHILDVESDCVVIFVWKLWCRECDMIQAANKFKQNCNSINNEKKYDIWVDIYQEQV